MNANASAGAAGSPVPHIIVISCRQTYAPFDHDGRRNARKEQI
jgi:hypothetical protein